MVVRLRTCPGQYNKSARGYVFDTLTTPALPSPSFVPCRRLALDKKIIPT